MYMLDTNICIFLINRKHPGLAQKIADIPFDEICVSTITQSELEYGVSKSRHKAKNAQALVKFLSTVTVLDYDTKAAEMYGNIRADLERKGQLIGPLDMLIASHALSKGFIVVTNNVGEFERVEGLKVEDWVNMLIEEDSAEETK